MCNISKRYVSDIFEEKPIQWGLRGIHFWGDLKEYFKKVEFPYSKADLLSNIMRLHIEITGKQLTADNDGIPRDIIMVGCRAE